jgi:hypothetical protein
MRAAMLALLRSDVPLDEPFDSDHDTRIRRRIADTWERENQTKQQERLDQDLLLVQYVQMFKRNLHQRGMTMAEAEDRIAGVLGYKDGETLRTIVQRLKRRLKISKNNFPPFGF